MTDDRLLTVPETLCAAVLWGVRPGMEYSMGLDFHEGVKASFDSTVRVDHKKLICDLGYKNGTDRIRDIIHDEDVNVVIFFLDSDFDFDVGFFSELQKKCFMILHVGDGEQYFERSARYYAQAFDLVLTAGYLNQYQFEQYGVKSLFFPSGFSIDGDMSRPPVEEGYNHEVTFIGVLPNKVGRQFYIDTLVGHGVDVSLFGAGTAGGVLDREKMLATYRTSMINLNFTGVSDNCVMDHDTSINRRIKIVKGRCQEIALAGGFVLSEYAPGIEALFEIGSEIAVFHNKAELLDQVSYYLNHEDERKAMAVRAHERAIVDYDEKEQWKQLRKALPRYIAAKNLESNVVYLDKIFRKAFSAFRLSRAIEWVLHAKWRYAIEDLMTFVKYPLIDMRLFVYYMKSMISQRFPRLRRIVRKFR